MKADPRDARGLAPVDWAKWYGNKDAVKKLQGDPMIQEEIPDDFVEKE